MQQFVKLLNLTKSTSFAKSTTLQNLEFSAESRIFATSPELSEKTEFGKIQNFYKM